jgi:hypothetical protein
MFMYMESLVFACDDFPKEKEAGKCETHIG